MALVSEVIRSARYDLGDMGQKFDDDQLVNYLNRIMQLLDRLLIARGSDFTLDSTTDTLSSGSNTITEPTLSTKMIQLYYGTIRIYKEYFNDVSYRYQINSENSSTGSPSYWAHKGSDIFFNIDADDDYTITLYYHQRTATLTMSSDMPYSDFFNEYLREALIIMASKAKDDKIVNVDMQFHEMFKQIVNSTVIGRNHVPKYYNLGF